MKAGAVGLMSVLAASAASPQGFAEQARPGDMDWLTQNEATAERMTALITAAERLEQRNDAGLLEVKPGVKLQTFDPDEVSLLVAGLLQTNFDILAGKVGLDEQLGVHSTRFTIQNHLGNRVLLRWWGYGIALNNDTIQRVVSAINSDTGKRGIDAVAQLVGTVLTDNPYGGILIAFVVAVLMSLGVGFLQKFSQAHGGIIIWHTWTGQTWITGQD